MDLRGRRVLVIGGAGFITTTPPWALGPAAAAATITAASNVPASPMNLEDMGTS